MITEETITNFFEGKCDDRDAAIVHAWLSENPAKLKEYLGVKEWEDFQSAHVLSPDTSGKLWNSIYKNSGAPTVHYPYFKWIAVAASVLLVISLSWLFIVKKSTAGAINTAATAKAQHIFNNTPQKMALTLSDGSTIELSPNSTLSYTGDFNAVKRDVLLNGEANFNIAKDAARPFSVHSTALDITVLGTRFTVRSYEGNTATKVILHEGKVMVKLANPSAQDGKNGYYLTPGDIFIFKKADPPSRPATTGHIETLERVSADSSLSARILHLEKDKDDCYVFDNYPLDVVFDQLQIIYNTKITYNKADLSNRSFIGKIDKKDSLSHILKSITLLNNFYLHKQGDGFLINN